MEATIEIVRRVLHRLGFWRNASIATVPPELAACEYECREKSCDETRFDSCERRLHTAEVLRAAEAEATAAVLEHPEGCLVPGCPKAVASPAVPIDAVRPAISH